MHDLSQGKDYEQYFEIPESAVRGIPLRMNGFYLSLALLEAGYKPRGKRGQLKWKKEEIAKKNLIMYGRKLNMHTGLVHYQPHSTVELDLEGYELDFVMCYRYLSKRMLNQFSRTDIKVLLSSINDTKPQKNKFRAILYEKDARRLDLKMKDMGNESSYSCFKGAVAELMVFKDIGRQICTGVNFFPNVRFNYLQDERKKQTEIDGIFTFYEQGNFLRVLRRLDAFDSLEIIVNGTLQEALFPTH